MPTYDYECKKCGYQFAVFQSIKDEPMKSCPTCKGRVRRLISGGVNFILKGSGFYVTDYRKPDYNKAAEGEKKAIVTSQEKPAEAKKIEKQPPTVEKKAGEKKQ